MSEGAAVVIANELGKIFFFGQRQPFVRQRLLEGPKVQRLGMNYDAIEVKNNCGGKGSHCARRSISAAARARKLLPRHADGAGTMRVNIYAGMAAGEGDERRQSNAQQS